MMSTVSNAQMADVTAVRVAAGLLSPVYVVSPPGDDERLFIVEQFSSSTSGRIRILNLNTGQLNPRPFLTIGGLATDFQDYGLLGMTFHPDYSDNGLFYVNFMPTGADRNVVRSYEVSRNNPDRANPASDTDILTYFQPSRDHNGGWLGFGPDGYLYVPTGDGGYGDSSSSGQDITDQWLGKILRIDINNDDFPADPKRNYAIPGDNPFVGRIGDDEIWAYGLRHPWRVSFDRMTGDLYIGDVGQHTFEEINVQPAGSRGGENYGWRLREGTSATPTGGVGGARPPGAVDPIYAYQQGMGENEGFAVIGGYVYRGPLAELQGKYFFGDFVTNQIWSIQYDGSHPGTFDGTNFSDFVNWTNVLDPSSSSFDHVSSFGEDNAGNLYIVDYTDGEIYLVTRASSERNWNVNTSGDWHDPHNWEGANSPNGNMHRAVFGNVITSPRTVFSNADATVQHITFDNSNSYVIMGSGSVNLDTDGGHATVLVLQGSHQLQLPVNLHIDTDVEVGGSASLVIDNALDLNGKTLSKRGAGTLAINNELNTDGGQIDVIDGILSGKGSIGGTLNNHGGIFSPGDSPGQFSISGDYVQGPAGTLFIEIAENVAVDGYDVLTVQGAAKFSGTFELALLDGFKPTFGDVFEILQAGTISGDFDTLRLPMLENGLWWDTSVLSTDGRLLVVPEPPTHLLLYLMFYLFLEKSSAMARCSTLLHRSA